MDKNTESLVQKIHASSIKAVLNVTGGGVSALNWLLSIPGASRTIIDVTIPYSQKASYLLLGSDPVDGYSGKEQSKRLAKVAYEKAAKATEIGDWDFVGLGVACALATDRTKKGDHRCCITVQNYAKRKTYIAKLEKELRNRIEEDIVASQIVLIALAEFCGVIDEDTAQNAMSNVLNEKDDELDIESDIFPDPIESLLSGDIRCVEYYGDHIVRDAPRVGALLLPGSFNPVHDGHLSLLKAAENVTGRTGMFEMTVTNPDKGTIDTSIVKKRLLQFTEKSIPFLLTRAPLFRDKAEMFPDSIFVVGYDTAVRILDPKYYGGTDLDMGMDLQCIRSKECRFMVAGRTVEIDGKKIYRALENVAIPTRLEELFLPLDNFRVDISSTMIRSQQRKHLNQETE